MKRKEVLLTTDTFEVCGWSNFTELSQKDSFKWTFRKTKMGVEFELTFCEFTYEVVIKRVSLTPETVFKGKVFNPRDFMAINRCIFDNVE